MENLLEMLGAAFMLSLGIMSSLWLFYLINKNAGVVDVGWALAFVAVSWAYLFLGNGFGQKRWILAGMVTAWGLRLAYHLYMRLLCQGEDKRYQEIRKNWGGKNSDAKFLMMYIFQGVLVVLLSLPFLIVSADATAPWVAIEWIGFLVWLVGVVGETYADKQLTVFKAIPENRDKVCREGLWNYSRHPNYFFELIVWIGYFLFALGTSYGWLALISPVLMLILLTKVSGVAITEAESLKSKGADYLEYQRTTSSFIPWFHTK